MFSFPLTSIFLFAAEGGGGFAQFYNEYLNYPGFEAWKFLNLGVFVVILVYLLKKKFSVAFKTRREEIRSELIKAEAEKQAALAQLKDVKKRVARLDAEREEVLKKAKEEASAEKKRLAAQTKADIERMKQQMQSELGRLAGQTHAELRRFSAGESIRLAEEKLRKKIGQPEDAQLVKASISEIGGLN